MYHSIYFGDKNTWDDWHIVSSSRPVLAPPTQKTKYVDIPGADGVLDLSTSLTGYPVYNNREGSFEFLVMNGYKDWTVLYSEIMEHLHGQKMRLVLEDDPGYFYEGRFSVNEWKSSHPWSTLSINYNVGPYKWSKELSTDEWLWDIFNFETGVIRSSSFKDIPVNSPSSWEAHTFEKAFAEVAPVCPEFYVSEATSDIHVQFNSQIVKLTEGSNIIPDFVIYGQDKYTIWFKGQGKVSMNFRTGRL